MGTAFGDVLAEETHTGRMWCLIVLPALIVPAVSVIFFPTSPARWGLAVVGIVGVATLAMMWSGFQYRFSPRGVEIWMLGFRLREIPKQEIVSYSIESWGISRGGYGIRGIGRTRAYVWGNRVVHIKLTNGDVFLGHSDPDRIVRDLDCVTGFVSRG